MAGYIYINSGTDRIYVKQKTENVDIRLVQIDIVNYIMSLRQCLLNRNGSLNSMGLDSAELL